MLTLFKGLNISYLIRIAGVVFIMLLLASLFMLHIGAQHARQHSAYMKTIIKIYHHVEQLNVNTAPQRNEETGLPFTKWQESLNQLGQQVRLLQQGARSRKLSSNRLLVYYLQAYLKLLNSNGEQLKSIFNPLWQTGIL